MGETVSVFLGPLLLVAVGWLLVAIFRTVRHKRSFANLNIAGVRFWLEHLYQSRQAGAYVIFEDMDRSKRFVQFRRDVGDAGAFLVCEFPLAEWSSAYVQSFEKLLDEMGAAYVRRRHDTVGSSQMEFVACENLDPATAAILTDKIFRQVFGHTELLVRVWGNNLSALDATRRRARAV